MPAAHEPAAAAGHVAAKRAGLVAVCAVLAVLAMGSGLDRAAATSPGLARHVPAPFAALSLIARGGEAVSAQRFAEAEDLAKAALRAAPVEPESASIHGAALLGLGKPAEAERAFIVAGQFGWRTPLTQYYWMQQALAVGDTRVAALRLDAMLRQDPRLLADRMLMNPLETTLPGRDALAQRLVEQPGWLGMYASEVTDIPPDVAMIRADVLDLLARKGKPLGCAAAGPLTTVLANAGAVARAHAMWRTHCPGRTQGLISDADFTALQTHQPDSPFDWVVIGDSDVSLSLDPAGSPGGGRRLMIASSASFPRNVLTQLAPLPPGTYRLEWSGRTEGGKLSQRLLAAVTCQADSRDWLPAQADTAGTRFAAEFTVDGTCPARWVSFTILPGQEAISLGDIALREVRQAHSGRERARSRTAGFPE